MDRLPQIVILGNQSKNNISKYVWLEACQEQNITYVSDVNKKSLFRSLYRIFFNRYSCLIPFWSHVKEIIDHSFFSRYLVYNIPPQKDIVICTNASLGKLFPYKILEKYRRKNKTKVVVFLYDTFDKLPNHEMDILNIEKEKGLIDKIYSFDPLDCSKYDFSYLEQCYTPVKLPSLNNPCYDIYFGGRNKGRLSVISSFLQFASINNVKCFFRMPELTQAEKYIMLKHNLFIFKEQMLSYEETLQEMQYANCILEIIQEGQHGISWRTIEAFVYNKKLLTNNKDIINNPFYNPEYIHIFSKVDDIDFNWVKERIPVDYHYHNEYSPLEFIQKMQRDLNL